MKELKITDEQLAEYYNTDIDIVRAWKEHPPHHVKSLLDGLLASKRTLAMIHNPKSERRKIARTKIDTACFRAYRELRERGTSFNDLGKKYGLDRPYNQIKWFAQKMGFDFPVTHND